ncbi:autotransporter assembly complex protein TamA [Ferrimonas marina]|uniref:Translocation and assembly module subunit TamA n=1 Tax=Ferrimonas marina TaxID=299255 RepID=A0A1M5YV18_9GAMM|nr:autotransporter assembly complex family protein [Ferrimonas marina]SHI15708.1 autotransporter secretion outer membrane protein TamA [Ferrimonas marina]
MLRYATVLLLCCCLLGQYAVAEPVKGEKGPQPQPAQQGQAAPSDGGLSLSVTGGTRRLRDNVRAHLSPLPTNPAERASFLFTYQDKAQEALQALGYYQGTLNPTIERKEGNWSLSLELEPGEPMRYQFVTVLLEGEARQDPAFINKLNNLKIQPGDVLNHGDYESLKTSLITLGLIRGYFDGEMVQNRLELDRDNNIANLVLLYDSGRRYGLGEVTFWASELNPDVLESMVPFEPGTPYHSDEIGKLTNSLFSSGYFQDVKVLPHPEQAEDGLVPVEVGIAPPPRHSLQLGFGFATDTQFRISTIWRTPVVNRYGHSQETRGELSQVNPKLSFDYRIPLSHPLNDQLQFQALVGREEFGDIDSNQYQAQIGRKQVSENGWTRSLYLRALLEDWSQDTLDRRAHYAMPGISFTHTRRAGPPLDPRTGFRQTYQFEHGDSALGSSQRITRFRAQLRAVFTPYRKHRIASRLDFGVNVINDDELVDLAPSLRFFAGGDQSIRGFGYQTLGPTRTVEDDDGNQTTISVGGRYLLVGSLEYQYYWRDKWRFATFVDSGNAFDINESEAIDVVTSVGVGAHWISPIGPIRLDVGFGVSEPDTPWRIHVTIGAEL